MVQESQMLFYDKEDVRLGLCGPEQIGGFKGYAQTAPITPEITPAKAPYKGVKDSFEKAFQRIGGVDALVEWGKEHQSAFFNMMPKLLPPELKVDLEATLTIVHALAPPRNLGEHAPTVHWDVDSLVRILRELPEQDREQIRLALAPQECLPSTELIEGLPHDQR